MDWFKHRGARSIGVEIARRGEPNSTGDRSAEIGEDVAEQVVCHDDVVTLRVFNEVDASSIDMVVGRRNIGEFRGNLIKGALPEISSKSQNVGLMDESEVLAITAAREFKGITDTAFNTVTGIY